MGSAGLLLFAVVAGFNYGGILVLYAACAARIWGAENVGQVYGWLFSANIPAATFPVLAGFGYDRWQSFIIPLSVIAVLLLAATIGVQRLGGTIGTSSRHCRPLQQS
jgi:OFA family oxalate/formate antiporter-like MFS transporter